MNARVAACALSVLALFTIARADAAPGALTAKMSRDNYLLAGKWSCSGGGGTYFAEYSVAPGNSLHGHLYSAQGSEDVYLGYSDAAHRYWTASVDSAGAIESQTSADGVTYVGTLFDGKTTSKATNVYTVVNSRRWTVHARGTASGQPYDLIATCVRM
ncbi:MAG TPA: hypothetical protein VKT51_05380 [Candidatus Eremiobacteraceae bacterium]|nr:hypothetical protein [Candidatus Eremiobacteraceae bacterium]